MAILIRRRRDSAANWGSVNPVIPVGQLAFELGTGEFGTPRVKFGNGVDNFSSLPYLSRKNNLTAVSDPAVTNNASQSYQVGSVWLNTASLGIWVLTSFSGSDAIWTPWGNLIRSLSNIADVPDYPNDGYDYILVEQGGVLSWELYDPAGGAVSSVNGQTGVVNLSLDDLNDVPPYPNDGYNYVLVEESGGLSWAPFFGGGVDSVNGQTGIVILRLEDIDDIPPYPNDGYEYLLRETDGSLFWELDVPPIEEEVIGTATYNGAMTGTVNLDLSTFASFYGVLTANTVITVTNTPATGDAFVRSLTIRSTATETLTLPVSWKRVGDYVNDGSENELEIKFSNFPTEGLKVTAYINQPI